MPRIAPARQVSGNSFFPFRSISPAAIAGELAHLELDVPRVAPLGPALGKYEVAERVAELCKALGYVPRRDHPGGCPKVPDPKKRRPKADTRGRQFECRRGEQHLAPHEVV